MVAVYLNPICMPIKGRKTCKIRKDHLVVYVWFSFYF